MLADPPDPTRIVRVLGNYGQTIEYTHAEIVGQLRRAYEVAMERQEAALRDLYGHERVAMARQAQREAGRCFREHGLAWSWDLDLRAYVWEHEDARLTIGEDEGAGADPFPYALDEAVAEWLATVHADRAAAARRETTASPSFAFGAGR